MTGLESNLMDLIGGLISFFLTLFVLSYVFGDHFLFRLAIHIFIGVSAAFVVAAAFYSILWPQLIRPLILGSVNERLYTLLPLLLCILLAAKALPRYSNLGAPVIAFMVGVGAATMIGGGIFGTLVPQLQASLNHFDTGAIISSGSDLGVVLINSSLVLFGTLVTFASFHFGTRAFERAHFGTAWKIIYGIGRVFIAITLGVIFAGVYTAALTALVERLKFLLDFVLSLVVLA